MRPLVRRLCQALLLAGVLCALPGCFGGSQNPSYFPYLLPTGDIIQTHAKPPGSGYYANFDPHAVRLEVRPNTIVTNPVRTQHVIVATIYDEKGVPRRDRRIEWMIEGVGNILEVDESGCLPGRGYKVDSKYAVSYTNSHEHQITRGNANPGDDFVIRPGQSWCVVSAAVEGDTHVTVYAPGIYDWQKNRQVVTLRWVDAGWLFPQPAAVAAGSEHVLTTRVFRPTEQQPLANYHVRYKLLDGPAALFPRAPRKNEIVAVSDDKGLASASLVQLTPRPGINRIGVEVIRPPDPTAPSGVGIVLASSETTVEWLAPALAMSHTGPASVGVGQDITYTIALSNSGKVEARSMTVSNPVPPGLQYLRSDPPAVVSGGKLLWTLGKLPPGQAHTIQAVFKTLNVGTVNNCASVLTEEGIREEKCAITTVGQPGLRVSLSAPATGTVNVPINYQITVGNPGTVETGETTIKVNIAPGLEHNLDGMEKTVKELKIKVAALMPGESKTLQPLPLTPRLPGKLLTRVTATAAGGLTDTADHVLLAQQAQLNIGIDGPKKQFVGQSAEWRVNLSNPGNAAVDGVVVRYKLPPEMTLQSSEPPGKLENGEVVWNLGTLAAQGKADVKLKVRGEQVSAAAAHRVVAVADAGVNVTAQANVELTGVPALQLKVTDVGDPVQIGKRITYQIEVTNTGSLNAGDVAIRVTLPPELTPVADGTTGPTKPATAGQTVTFAPLAALTPQQTAKFEVVAEAKRAGSVKARVELTSKALDGQPVFEEESTTIYDAGNGPTATPLPPPTGSGLPQPWTMPAPLPAGPKTP